MESAPVTPKQLRSENLQIVLAILTLLLVAAECITHQIVHGVPSSQAPFVQGPPILENSRSRRTRRRWLKPMGSSKTRSSALRTRMLRVESRMAEQISQCSRCFCTNFLVSGLSVLSRQPEM
jgi:hypothetical protein